MDFSFIFSFLAFESKWVTKGRITSLKASNCTFCTALQPLQGSEHADQIEASKHTSPVVVQMEKYIVKLKGASCRINLNACIATNWNNDLFVSSAENSSEFSYYGKYFYARGQWAFQCRIHISLAWLYFGNALIELNTSVFEKYPC